MDPVVVVGAGGRQGRATALELRLRDIPVRALVRDPSHPAALALASRGCELLAADLDRARDLDAALAGAARAFVYLPLGRSDVELRRGRALFEAAARNGIGHLVYSAALGSDRPTGVPHFESKLQLRRILADTCPAWTVLDPGSFMDNLLYPRTWQGLRRGRLVTPFAPAVRQALVAVTDIGRSAAACLAAPVERWAGKTVPLYAEALTGIEQAEVLGRLLDSRVDARQLPALVTRVFLGRDLARMFRHFNRNPPVLPPTDDFRRMVAAPLSFGEWARQQLDASSP